MTFKRDDYISPNEKIILRGTILHEPGWGPMTSCTFCLTDKKIIKAGENILEIIPLNKVTAIRYVHDGKSHATISTDNHHISLFPGSNPEWFQEIVQEIAKRIG